MLANYLLIAWRNICRTPMVSAINILGLAVGMTCCLLILIVVRFETSYDQWIPGHENLFQMRMTWNVYQKGTYYLGDGAPHAVKEPFLQELPEIEAITRLQKVPECTVQKGKDTFEATITLADPNFFDLFQLEFLLGDPLHALDNPGNIVLTQSSAQKYFGDSNPIGQSLSINAGGHRIEHRVSAVIADIPENSHLDLEAIVPLNTVGNPLHQSINRGDWFNIQGPVYLKLAADQEAYVESRMPDLIDKYGYMDETAKANNHVDHPSEMISYYLEPLSRIHLFGSKYSEGQPDTRSDTIASLSAVGLLILFIAIINFTNLSTSQATLRLREVGVRRSCGGHRRHIAQQIFCESILLALFALAVALVAAELVLPSLRTYLNGQFDFSLSRDWQLIPAAFGLALITGILGGLYPAIKLSRIAPTQAFAGVQTRRGRSISMRSVLVTLQFSASIFLLISTWVVLDQIHFALNQEPGYHRDQLIGDPCQRPRGRSGCRQAPENPTFRTTGHQGHRWFRFCPSQAEYGRRCHGSRQPGARSTYNTFWICVDSICSVHMELNPLPDELLRNNALPMSWPSNCCHPADRW